MTKQGKNDANVWCDILNNVHGYSMFLMLSLSGYILFGCHWFKGVWNNTW